MNVVKLITKQFILNIKFFIGNPVNILLCLSIILFSLLVSMIFIPLTSGAGLVFSLSLLPICGIVYASMHFNVRKSTLYSNISLTKNNRWTFNGSVLLTILTLGFIVANIIFFSLLILNRLDLVMVGWLKYTNHTGGKGNLYYGINFELYLMCMYASILSSVIVFSLSFMFNHLIKTQKTYFIIIVSLTILMVIFGGTLNDYWGFGDKGVAKIKKPLFPWELYWLGLIQPLFGPSNLINSAYDANIMRYVIDPYTRLPIWLGFEPKLFYEFLFNKNNPILWKFQNIFPYIEIVGYLFIGVVISKIYNNK